MIYQAGSAYRYGKAQNVVYLCSQPIREKGNTMNANNITEITITMSDGTAKRINVNNGMILVLMGSGPMDGAFWTKLEQATEAELEAAEGEIIEKPIHFDEKLAKANEELQQSQVYNDFEKAVEFMVDLSADEFVELVLFSKDHANTFPKFCKELRNVVNADDAYCSALISLARPFHVEEKAFALLDSCMNCREFPAAFEQFNKLWESLKTLRDLVD